MLLVACLFGGVKSIIVVVSLALLRPTQATPVVDATWLFGWPPPPLGPCCRCFHGGGGLLLPPQLVDAAELTLVEEEPKSSLSCSCGLLRLPWTDTGSGGYQPPGN